MISHQVGLKESSLEENSKDMFSEISVLLTIICIDSLQTRMIAENGKSQA